MAPPRGVADTGTRLRSLGHVVLVVAGAFLAGLLLAATGVSLLSAVGLSRETDLAVLVVASTVFQFLGFYAVVYWYFRTVGTFADLVHVQTPTRRDAAWAIGGLVVLFLANVLVSQLLAGAGLQGAQNQIVQRGREQPRLFLYLIPATILFVAPAEELLFRGAVQGQFRRAYGTVIGVVSTAAVFGVVHWAALGGSGSRGATVVVIVTLGLVLGTLYELSRNLFVSMAIHAGWNVLIFAWEYAAVTGFV
jgi:membrane protease YdiL (CAAX protease family)